METSTGGLPLLHTHGEEIRLTQHSILIVMEWAKRELSALSSPPTNNLSFSSAYSNIHSLLSRMGVLESSPGNPTALGQLLVDLFGQTAPQRTRGTLQRTFSEFLAVLEESINNELTYSTSLFALFEAIDRQFLNLQRTVIRETDAQEREEGELLSSLWTRAIGANASRLRKFSKNRELLASLRSRTITNKSMLLENEGRLLQLKSNLEMLRKKLVSPLIAGGAGKGGGSMLSVEEQIRGLDGTREYLGGVRERQKMIMMERLYGAGSRRVGLGREGGREIEGR